MDKCNSCSNSTTSCTCKKKPAPCSTSCSVKTSTDCVIYDANPHRSNLTCFLGVNNGTNLTKILEILDKKLCIPISKCARERFGLGSETDISMAMIRLLDYVCQMEDAKVKVSEDDTTNGYLFDKIETGDCIRKVITKDYLGAEKLKLELDFPCIESRLNCCGGNNTSISIQGTNTVCGNNTTLLTAVTNCTSTVQWSNGLTGPTIQASAGVYYATCGGRQSNTITVTSTGNCGCIPIWRDATPLAIFCGQVLGNNPCKKYIKQSNQCNTDIQWVEYTGSNSDGSGCDGCAPTNFIATRSQTFVRQSCPTGCTPGSVTFGKNYYSTVSQAVADTLATNDNNFLTEGQNYANATGSCTNCPGCTHTTWTNTGQSRCQNNVSQIEQSSNCNTIPNQWVNGGNACNTTCTPVWSDTTDAAVCGSTLGNGYDSTKMYKKQSNQCNSNTQWVQNGDNCPITCTTTSWTATSEYACNNNVSQRKYTSNQCQGVFEWRNEGTACVTTYTSNIPTPATFTRNNCASGCTAGSIQYSILATSFISQVDANNKFNTEGQAAANQNGTCTNCPCVTTSWTATTEYACNGGVSQRKYTSNQCSGVFEWRNEGDACNNSRTILLSSPTTSSSEDACLVSSGSTKYISNTVAISNGLEIFNNSTLTTRTYNTNPGNWSTIIDGSSKYAVQFDSTGIVSVIVSCTTTPPPPLL